MAIVKISDLPLVDQPVEGTDLFVVVQDNVTKKAYASDIQTYVGFEEIQYATAGQTVFNLTTMSYAPGGNNLMVFVDGVNQYEGLSYTETNSTRVTFTQGLHVGAVVKFSTVQTQTSSVANAGAVTFLQAGTGAVARSVQTKLREVEISVKDFGAVGDGATYDSPAILAAVNAAQTFIANAAGYGQQIGVKLKFPIGKYRISEPIPILYGIKFVGEQSGLVNAGNTLSTGTVLLLSNTKADGSAWTSSTLTGGNTIAKRVMFYIVDGGPSQMEYFGAITENNNSANSIFLVAGGGWAPPYDSVGVTQALYRGIRVFEFESVFYGSRFADVTIENCGFEYNTYVFQPIPRVGAPNDFGGINSTSTQYFENYAVWAISGGVSFNNSNFSSCVFYSEGGTNGSLALGYSGNISNVHFSSCDFIKAAGNTGGAFAILDDAFVFQANTFSSCRFKDLPMVPGGYHAPAADQFVKNAFTGNVFENSFFFIDYEGDANVFVGNVFVGTSYFDHKGGSFVFAGNTFDRATNSGNDFICSATGDMTVVGNHFRANKQSISYSSVTTYKVVANLNLPSRVSSTLSNVTAGSGGWSAGSAAPQYAVNESGYLTFKGSVANSGSPAADSIMCSTPAGARTLHNQYFVLPANDGSADYATVLVSTNGNVLFKNRSGTATEFDLSPINCLVGN